MKAFIAIVISVLGVLAAEAETSTIRCQSFDGSYEECRIALPGTGRVTLQLQLGQEPCVRNQTWGTRGKTIWVSGGCRGLFRFTPDLTVGNGISRPSTFSGKTIRCESSNIARKVCPTSTLGGVRLVHQLSILPCTLGETWGYSAQGIWVDSGCRADFRVGGSFAPPPPPTVTCESTFGDPAVCPADTRRGVRLTRRLSRTDCILNETWGYDARSIWVSGGCRAQFTVGR